MNSIVILLFLCSCIHSSLCLKGGNAPNMLFIKIWKPVDIWNLEEFFANFAFLVHCVIPPAPQAFHQRHICSTMTTCPPFSFLKPCC